MAGGTGKLQYEIAAPAASDKIAVTGTAQIGIGLLGFNDFTLTALPGITSGTYVLLTTTGGITGSLDQFNHRRNGEKACQAVAEKEDRRQQRTPCLGWDLWGNF